MSVTIIARSSVADVTKAVEWVRANAPLAEEITAYGKSLGQLGHRIVTGDDELVVIDEWGNAEQFQKFFERNTKIEEFVVGTGATGAPAISVFDSVEMPGTF